jgi:hypothetical protein
VSKTGLWIVIGAAAFVVVALADGAMPSSR